MSLAVVFSRALDGLRAPEVRVEVHLANGLPSFTLVGLADTEVKEARERVRAALAQCGFEFPHNRRVTVNLAPADLPKESGRFDLPIAIGLLAAQGLIDTARLERLELAGELSLAGDLRPVRGALALALASRAAGTGRTLVLPTASAAEAARVPGLPVRAARHLSEVVDSLLPDSPAGLSAPPPPEPAPPLVLPDLAEVRGQAGARRALEIAAAGGHSLLLVGPPGTGKSMLAQRLPGLMPPMDEDEALESAALQGLAPGGFDPARWRLRPWRAPHHSASAVALVGGGSPPRPGEISLAHGGVLFLDELPEFQRVALEALREPLESGHITISRAARQAQFPARFQLLAAMNPCPCGWLGARPDSGRQCRCSPEAVLRYQRRLSGPLLDRIDMQVEVPLLPPAQLLAATPGEASAVVRGRVERAREHARQRQGERPNAWLGPAEVGVRCEAEPAASALLQSAAERLGWSGRGLHRVLRIARTIADLQGLDRIPVAAVAEAIQYRRALADT